MMAFIAPVPSQTKARVKLPFTCPLNPPAARTSPLRATATAQSTTPSPSPSPSPNSDTSAPGSTSRRRIISALENVSYDVGGVRVIEDVSFHLFEGEIVCILGPSGSGKSTILRILAGLVRPSRGEALYHGRPFIGTNPGTSIVFQTFALYPWLTVVENVELGLSDSRALNHDHRRALAMRVIDIIGLDGYENAYPRELSGGMRQRVGFARALAVEPELLCMDEPFSALDVLTAENLRSELLRLWQAGDVPTTSVLIVTHSIEEAVSLADRVVVLGKDPGRIRTILPIKIAHPRDRKSTLFQSITDLVYTILSDSDYTLSEEDLNVLNGRPSSIPSPATPEPIPVVSQRLVGEDVDSMLQDGVPSTALPVMVDSLSLSEPLQLVNMDLNQDITPPANSVRFPQLPAVRIGSVSGLLSFIGEEPADLYLLGQRLQLDVDDLYPLIDAANALGLIEVDEGDVRVNNRGHRFLESSIDDRKNIVRLACLSSSETRLIAQIYRMVSQSPTQQMPQELIFDTVLLKHFSPIEARRQLEIAIEWGRFAELIGYEALTGMLFLDTGEDPSHVKASTS